MTHRKVEGVALPPGAVILREGAEACHDGHGRVGLLQEVWNAVGDHDYSLLSLQQHQHALIINTITRRQTKAKGHRAYTQGIGTCSSSPHSVCGLQCRLCTFTTLCITYGRTEQPL